ncbi:MAG TPA: hypothetical protein VGJ08_14575 [Rhizomicrobium sp.]|jgi:hypothetical protein
MAYYNARLEDKNHAPVLFYSFECPDDQSAIIKVATIETVPYRHYEIWRGQDELIATGPRPGRRPFERRARLPAMRRLPIDEALILALRQSVNSVRDILRAGSVAH